MFNLDKDINRNPIDITDLQKSDLTVGDLRDIIAVMEYSVAMLVLPVVKGSGLENGIPVAGGAQAAQK
jgi:hypothetical protein